jgi:hypothetical protein
MKIEIEISRKGDGDFEKKSYWYECQRNIDIK